VGFSDRLADDANRVFLGSDHFEEDLTFSNQKGTVTGTLQGVVDVLSLDTGGMAENEINPGIMSVADIYVASSKMPTTPNKYDTFTTSSGNTWRVIQRNLENGMWVIRCTDNQVRRHGRSR
jgi:hypothetical protein